MGTLALALCAASAAASSLVASNALGGAQTTDSDLERASGSRTVAVGRVPGGDVSTFPLELYVARVLAGEGEPGAADATQQALAIAIRTYALFNARRHGRDGFDLCDTTHCQVLRAATAGSRRAALETAGRVLIYNGAPAEIFYSASCGGRSETASNVWPTANLPYLQSHEDDVHADDEPWTLELTLAGLQDILRRHGFEGTLRDVEVTARTESGRVAQLRLSGLTPGEMGGPAFRLAIGAGDLRSTAFSVTRGGRTLRFVGRGYGHGVGMCVIGAGRRARRGESAETILAHYYPGLVVATLAGAPARER